MTTEAVFRIRRGGAADDPAERFDRFRVALRPRMTVLDALVAIQSGEEPTLSFRYSCRVGMCGTCALRVNGRPRWACRTRVEGLGGEVRLEPLTHFPVLRDLAVDMAVFFEKMKRARGWLEPSGEAAREPVRLAPESPERRRIEPHIECITCGICYAACGMVGHMPDYLGPAALNRAFTLVADSRDGRGAERLAEVCGEHGAWRCHSQFNCTEACPKGISPSDAIQALKRRALAGGARALAASLLRGLAPGSSRPTA
ncbi:MAG: succinate dehydrogenase/fumarate reductase iron-sulfur subunit [Candidatus Tectomicrobia bacterium]|nr:succinate dehydrogenase/fumarate reductase iron-sulfur subunit [Candidatus Tectomicrobia bacterium]